MTATTGNRLLRVATAVVALAFAPLGGCGSTTDTATSSSPGSTASRAPRSNVPDPAPDAPGRRTAPAAPATDACADRLHALCGPLLFYYAVHRRMPPDLAALRTMPDAPGADVDFTCPVSGQPYVYNPAGLPRAPGKPGSLVLYDAAPTHSARRWAVAVAPPKTTGQALVPEVVLEDELTFRVPPEPAAE
jgi:hypothetical protein